MSYKVVFTYRALKDLKKIDKKTQKRLLLKIKEYSKNPFNYCIKLTSPIIGTYRYRIGDYRVIFDIEGKEIIILRIGHRKEIYK